MGLFSRIGKVETNWRSRAWLISPRKTKLTIFGRKIERPMQATSGINPEHTPPTQKTVDTTYPRKSSYLIDATFDPSIFASMRKSSCEYLGADLHSNIPERCYVCPQLIECYSAVNL